MEKILTLFLLFSIAVISGCQKIDSHQKESKLRGLQVLSDGTLLKDGRPYRGIGVNYFDAFIRTLDNPEDVSYREGFAQLAKRNIPFARFAACGFWANHMKQYQHDREGYFKRLDAVIASAQENGIGLIPTLFWYYACVPDLVGEPMEQWGNPESKTIAFMREYIKDVVLRYKNNPTIWAWEMGNEYLLETDLGAGDNDPVQFRPWILSEFGTPTSRSERDDITFEQVIVAYDEFAKVLKEIDPDRPLITGDAIPRISAFHMRTDDSWDIDALEEFKQNLLEATPEPYKVVSIHFYPEIHHPRFGEQEPRSMKDLFSLFNKIATQSGKALFIGEFGVTLPKDELDPELRKKEFVETVDAIEASGTALAAFWVFDFINPYDDPFQEKRITRIGNEYEWTLDVIAEANERLQRQGKSDDKR